MQTETINTCIEAGTTLILGIIGICITRYYSKHTQAIANETMMKQLFTEFNKRYDELNNYLAEIEQKYKEIDDLKNATKDGHDNYGAFLQQKVIDYFSLCAEEFYWYEHKKRIDPLIWKSWNAGMNYWYNEVETIKELWKKEIEANGKESYYIKGEIEFFKEKQS
jgi:hypothetical protein